MMTHSRFISRIATVAGSRGSPTDSLNYLMSMKLSEEDLKQALSLFKQSKRRMVSGSKS